MDLLLYFWEVIKYYLFNQINAFQYLLIFDSAFPGESNFQHLHNMLD
jgi:hypothetical protein